MSLRSVGSQLLQTPPSSLLLGTTQASISCWVQINPSGNITASGGVEVFGDAGGKFSITLAGQGQFALRWSSNDGHSNAASSCKLSLTPGTSYHIAATWQSGAQRYYVNGVSVQPDSRVGSIGILGDPTSHPFRLGSDQAGADVTLGEPTLWIGYVLTPQEVIDLRDRKATPSSVSAPFIALHYSLAGVDGLAARVGDPGLADLSTSGLNLSTILGSAPAYSATTLAYTPVPLIGDARVAPSGKSVVLTFQDGANNPSSVTSIASPSEVQQVSVNGKPSGSAFTLSLGGQSTAPITVDSTQPVTYGTWTFPTTAGHSYRICRPHDSASSASLVGFEVIDGGSVVLKFTASPRDADPGTAFSDSNALLLDGAPITWIPFPSNVTAAGTTLQVRITGSDGFVLVDVLRVDDLTASTVTYYDDQQLDSLSNPFLAGPYLRPATANQLCYRGTYTSFDYASGIGGRYLVHGGASVLQSALEALSSIGTGNVTVVDNSGNGTGVYRIAFGGTFTNQAAAILASSDSAAIVSEITHGGGFPVVSINGGTGISCPDVLYYTQPSPSALVIIPQPSPRVSTTQPGDLEASFSYSWFGDTNDRTLRGGGVFTNDPTVTGTINFFKVTPGTYQFSAYWNPASTSYYGTIYTPGTAIVFKVVDQDGTVLATSTVDQTIAPADYSDLGVGWKVIATGITTTRPQSKLSLVISGAGLSTSAHVIATIHAAQLRRTSTDPVTVIGTSDSATISLPGGIFITAAGVVPAISNQTVTPPSASAIIPAFNVSPKTARIGYNATQPNYYAHIISFSNLSYQAEWDLGKSAITKDVNGYPTKIAAQHCHAFVGGGTNISGMTKGNNPFPSGRYTLLWDGDPSLTLDTFNGVGGNLTEVGTPSLTGTGNHRTFDLSIPANLGYSPYISLAITGTTLDTNDGNYFLDIRNVRIYPPDPADSTGNTAWVNPSKFHPSYLAKFRGASCLRFMDSLSTIGNNWANLAQFKQDSHCSRAGLQTVAKNSVASIGNPSGNRYFGPNFKVVQVTTTAAQSFFDAAFINLKGCGIVQFSDGSTADLTDANHLVKMVDSTHFLVLLDEGSAPVTMTNTLTGGTVQAEQGTFYSINDIIDLVVATSVTDLWWNCPSSIDLTVGGGADQVASYLAAHLPVGVKVHVEFANECWNMLSPQYAWCHAVNTALHGGGTYDYMIYYADATKALHDRFQAMFSAVGRPNDVVHTYCGFAALPDRAGSIAARAKINGARIDEFAIAPYFNNKPTSGLSDHNLDIGTRMNSNQMLDFLEFNIEHGRHENYFTDHRTQLDTAGFPGTTLTTYEVAPETIVVMNPGYGGPPNNFVDFYPLMYAIKRHPRMFGIVSRMIQKFQDAGMDIWNHYMLCGGGTVYAWDAWDWWNQQVGTGDPTVDAINITNPVAMNEVKSQTAGALQRWAALVHSPVKVSTPIRNAKLRASGLRRGMLGKAR